VAIYERTLHIHRSVEDSFAFVSNFQNASRWDPRTYSASMTSEGPIGIGTRFVLTGGLLKGETVSRLHLPIALAGMPLPYDMIEFKAPFEFVLEGQSRAVRYRDRLVFSQNGDSTQLVYSAELELKGPLSVFDSLLQRAFKRIGDDATNGLVAAVEGSA
jgi:dehydrogenase/reductase SDR family protein 12